MKNGIDEFLDSLLSNDYSDGEEYMIDKELIDSYIELYLPSAKIDLRTTGRTRETISSYRADDSIKFILKVDRDTFEIELGANNSYKPIKNRIL